MKELQWRHLGGIDGGEEPFGQVFSVFPCQTKGPDARGERGQRRRGFQKCSIAWSRRQQQAIAVFCAIAQTLPCPAVECNAFPYT